MAVTALYLAERLRVTIDGAIPTALVEPVGGVLDASAAIVEEYAPAAPTAISDEAIVRLAGWLWDSGPSFATIPANAIQLSGASALLAPYRVRRAGIIAAVAEAAAEAAAAGLSELEVLALVRDQLSDLVEAWARTGTSDRIPYGAFPADFLDIISAQSRAVTADWAERDNADIIPADKLPAADRGLTAQALADAIELHRSDPSAHHARPAASEFVNHLIDLSDPAETVGQDNIAPSVNTAGVAIQSLATNARNQRLESVSIVDGKLRITRADSTFVEVALPAASSDGGGGGGSAYGGVLSLLAVNFPRGLTIPAGEWRQMNFGDAHLRMSDPSWPNDFADGPDNFVSNVSFVSPIQGLMTGQAFFVPGAGGAGTRINFYIFNIGSTAQSLGGATEFQWRSIGA